MTHRKPCTVNRATVFMRKLKLQELNRLSIEDFKAEENEIGNQSD